jgi:hypothetical protein
LVILAEIRSRFLVGNEPAEQTHDLRWSTDLRRSMRAWRDI